VVHTDAAQQQLLCSHLPQSSAIKGDRTSKLAPLAQWNAAPMSAVLSVALTCSSGVVSSTPAST
jgi:hypothetical protein